MDDYMNLDALGVIFLSFGGILLWAAVVAAVVWVPRSPRLENSRDRKPEVRTKFFRKRED